MKSETMKALVKTHAGLDGLELKRVPIPTPTGDQLLIKVSACAICGTDIHIWRDEYLNFPPVTVGHEFWGEVVALGPDVKHFEVGQFATAMSATSVCGDCPACRSGFYMRCENRRSLGSGYNGAMAEYVCISEDTCFHIPEGHEKDLSMAINEPLTCGAHAVFEQSDIKAGDLVVVLGPGVLGLGALISAKMQGAFVIVSGTPKDEERLALAKELGADIVNSDPSKLDEIVRKVSKYGADTVIECSGAAPGFATALEVVKRGGRITQIGLFAGKIDVDINQVVMKEVTVSGSMATSHYAWRKFLSLVEQGKIHSDKLVSNIFPIEEWEKAYEMTAAQIGYRNIIIPGDFDPNNK